MLTSIAMNEARTYIPDAPRQLVKVGLLFTFVFPLLWIAWRFFSVPSANPAQELNHLFGRIGFYALTLNLAIGNLLAILKLAKTKLPRLLSPLIAYRRHLGVIGVLYLVVHVSFHFLLEAGILEGLQAIAKARYLWFGSIAFVGCVVLAFTSNNWSMKTLGRRWKTLHRAVYPLYFLATTHTLMIEKADLIHFGFFATLVCLPLLFRVSWWLLKSRTASSDAR